MKSKKPNKKKIIITVAVLVVVAAFVFRLTLRPQAANFNEETAKTQDITTYYSFSGNIQSKDSQIVVSKKILPIKELFVKEGDVVKKGDTLFTLDDSNTSTGVEQAAASLEISKINYEKMTSTTKKQQMAQVSNALSSAKLSFDNAKLNLERTTELYQGEGISKQALEQAQSGYDTAKLQLDSAQDNYNVTEQSTEQNIRSAKEQVNQAQASYESTKNGVDDLTVTSEIDGVVSEIYVKENESIVTGTKIMDIIDYDNLEIVVKVDEFDMGAITVGKEVSVTINTLEKEVEGLV
jgi:HlyD family secretion protein